MPSCYLESFARSFFGGFRLWCLFSPQANHGPSFFFFKQVPLFLVRMSHLDLCAFLRRSIGRFRGLLLFVRNTSIFHALFVRGFQGLLLLVDLEVYWFPLQLLAPWFDLLNLFHRSSITFPRWSLWSRPSIDLSLSSDLVRLFCDLGLYLSLDSYL